MSVEVGKTAGLLRRKHVVIVAIAVLAALAIAGIGRSAWTGALAPADAAAKYAGFSYLKEDEVSDYINLYRKQIGLADSADSEWAAYLASSDLTPEALRYTTVRQMLKDRLVQKRAGELGIEASEEELDAATEGLKNTLGLGSDALMQEAMESAGQSEQGLRDAQCLAILKRKLLASEVAMPTPTDAETLEFAKGYIPGMENKTLKHAYCFRLVGLDEGGGSTNVDLTIHLQKQFAEGQRTADAFAKMVSENSNDAELVKDEGTYGWNADTSGYSEVYLSRLESLGLGDVSDVFVDNDAYAFIWVNDIYELPAGDEVASLDLEQMPASLKSYFTDLCAYGQWETSCSEYLEKMLVDANVVYYPMPADVPYNVDMSLADAADGDAENEERG